MSDDERWLGPWAALGVGRSRRLQELRASLLARYREPQRHYHTVRHLDECFERWPYLGPSTVELVAFRLQPW